MISLPRSFRHALFAFVAVLVAAPLSGQQCPAIFLVRHAETVDDTSERPLSESGTMRADALATLMRDSEIDRIYSTDFLRTQGTAAPAAEALGLSVEVYDPRALEDMAGSLREQGGRALVVGHSNTTPQLVQALGGEPGAPIDEATEHDRLYVVTLCPGADPTTVLLRYGQPG